LLRLSSLEAQTKLEIAQGIVGCLVNGKSPDTRPMAKDMFVGDALVRCQWYVSWSWAALKPKGKLTAYGAEALEKLMEVAKAKMETNPGEVSLRDVEVIHTYHFLLQGDQARKAQELIKQVETMLEERAPTAGEASSSGGTATGSSVGNASKKEKDDKAVAITKALSMFA